MTLKRCIYSLLFLALIVAIAGIFLAVGNHSNVTAESVVTSASDSVCNLRTIHMTMKSQVFNDGKLDRGAVEDVRIEFPDKLHSITNYSGADGTVFKAEMINDGDTMALFNFDDTGKYSSVEVFKNTCPFPGDAYSANGIYEFYIRQVNLLMDTNNYKLIAEESVNGRGCYKIQVTNEIDSPAPGTVSYWYLDKNDFILLKEETYKNGLLIYIMEIQDYEVDCNLLENEFNITIPSDINVKNGNLSMNDYSYKETSFEGCKALSGFTPCLPSYMPEGFKLGEIGIVNSGQVIMENTSVQASQVWKNPTYMTYTRDNQSIYICEDYVWSEDQKSAFEVLGLDYLRAQTIPMSIGEAYLFARGEKNGTLFFYAGDLKVKITGAATYDDLIKIAESIIAQDP